MIHKKISILLIAIAGMIVGFLFFAKSFLVPDERFGHVTYQADNQIMFDIEEEKNSAIFPFLESSFLLKVRNWSDKQCDVGITSTKDVIEDSLNPNGAKGFEKIFHVQPDDYIQFTICGREQTFYSSYAKGLQKNREYEQYARISQKLHKSISSGDASSKEFNNLYDAFGRELPIYPHLYAFHYEVLFSKEETYKPDSYIAGGIFDVAINERAKEKYNTVSWTTLNYSEVQELLEDPALQDLLKKVFQ